MVRSSGALGQNYEALKWEFEDTSTLKIDNFQYEI